MNDHEAAFAPFEARMRGAGMPALAIRSFRGHYLELRAGATGLVPEAEIAPVEALPTADTLPASLERPGREVLGRTVVIKLNGGLGTTMGMQGPKSLLPVRAGRTFLSIIADACRAQGVPLLLMNSFATQEDTHAALGALPPVPGPDRGIPRDLLQHQVPKVDRATLRPARSTASPDLEWCPPGHGDLYAALWSSGTLDALEAAGCEYAFVSNSDNLGATVSTRILGRVVEQGIPFLMEVADRTPADRKGGHLARRLADGQLLLRERAQCPADELEQFEDVARYRFFNTNSLWLHLPSLRRVLEEREGLLGLPLIVNAKTLDPRDPESPAVLQLETAMGAAISSIPGAQAIRVPRDRFSPVKTTSDLLAVRSDAYLVSEQHGIQPNPDRPASLPPLEVHLDPLTYRLIDQLDARFPYGAPSLLECRLLEVRGDVRFGREVRCIGTVRVAQQGRSPRLIPDGAVLKECSGSAE